jgi:hypothetical protein
MLRKQKIPFIALVLGTTVVLTGYIGHLWGLSSFDYVPIVVFTTVLGIIVWGWKDWFEKIAKGSEPIEPYYHRRGLEKSKPSGVRFWVFTLAIPVLLFANRVLFFLNVYGDISRIFYPYAQICYLVNNRASCSYQPVILLTPQTAIDAFFAIAGCISTWLGIKGLLLIRRGRRAN